MARRPPRLIDLHLPWLLQYAPETTFFDRSLYPEVPGRLAQLDGYLGATAAAVVAIGMAPDDWARRADRWAAMADLLARAESEFSGRLLIGPEDAARWRSGPPDAMAWAVLAIDGLNHLVREPDDLARLDSLFQRGVRVFRISDGSGDESTTVDQSMLDRMASWSSRSGTSGPRPVLDLAGLGPDAIATVLDWYAAGPEREKALLPLFSHGAPGALPADVLSRLRAMGAVLGFSPGAPWHESADALQAAITDVSNIAGPPVSSPIEGLAFGTAFLRVNTTGTGLGNATSLGRWASKTFGPDVASSLIHDTGARLVLRSIGAITENGSA